MWHCCWYEVQLCMLQNCPVQKASIVNGFDVLLLQFMTVGKFCQDMSMVRNALLALISWDMNIIEVVSFDFDEFDGVKSWHWLDDDCCHIIHLQIVTKKKENVSKCVYTNSVLFTIKPNENNKLQPNHNCVCQSHASENRPWNRTRCNQRKIGSWFSESKIGVISRDTFWKSWEQDDDGGMFHVLAGKWVIKSVQFVH